MEGSEMGRNRSETVGNESVCNAGDRVRSPVRPLEKRMTTNPSILARRIPWIEEQEKGITE